MKRGYSARSPRESSDRGARLFEELPDRELLALLVGEPIAAQLTPPNEGLFHLLWSDPRHIARRHSATTTERLVATAELARRISRAQVDRNDPLIDPVALVTHLFLQHSRRPNPTSGALYFDLERCWIGEEVVARSNSRRYELGIDTILRPAFALEADSFVLFQVRVGGDARPTEVEFETAARIHRAALLHRLRLIDFWIVVGPGRWTSLEAGSQAVSPYRVTAGAPSRRRARRRSSSPSDWRDEITLAALMRRGKYTSSRSLNAARRLLHHLGGLAPLAATEPRRLVADGLLPEDNPTLFAALEIAHRLRHGFPPERPSLHRPETLAGTIFERFAQLDRDARGVVLLDEFDGLVGLRELRLHRSTDNSLAAMMREAIESGASKIVPFRFYPSGRITPEVSDPQLFLKLKNAGATRDLQVFDHFHIFASGRFMAMGTQGEVRRFSPESRATA